MIAYKQTWDASVHPLQTDLWALSQTDEFLKSNGTTRFDVYVNIHHALWPQDEQHRWFLRGLKCIVENEITVLMGCSDSGKSYLMYIHAVIDFFAFPRTSLALISSTDSRSLEIRIWGKMKEYFNTARDRYDFLSGTVIDSKMIITDSEIDDEGERGRSLASGIVCVPCTSGGNYQGLGRFVGVKPPNSPGKNDGILKHYGDECQAMRPSFLDAYSNWYGKKFKGVMAGNPCDVSDVLCTAAEPIGTWDSFVDEGVTQEWKSRFYGAHVLAFDGRDSPNKDQPGVKFPFLISQKKIDMVASTEGTDSWKWFSQCVGKPSKNMISWRVITIGICEKNKAFETVIWKGGARTLIYGLDPSWGGGDRCVGTLAEFGEDVEGRQILYFHPPEIIPVKLNSNTEPEGQIAAFIKDKADKLSIPVENIGYDSFGRGAILAFAFAKVFGNSTPLPIDAGGRPSERPVRFDLFIEDIKNGVRSKRLKTCREHYQKHLSELWFAVREAVESKQVRNFSREVAEEGQLRLYEIVAGNKIEIESKEDLRMRVNKSPDLMDSAAMVVEMARRKGFRIERLGSDVEVDDSKNFDWFTRIADKARTASSKHSLSFK